MFSSIQKCDYAGVPSSIFTSPEVAFIGSTEECLKKTGISCVTKTTHFLSIGMAHILEDTQGFVKITIEEKTGRILAATMIGLSATELVNIFSLAIHNNLTIDNLKKTIFAHPSISEIIGEVAKSF